MWFLSRCFSAKAKTYLYAIIFYAQRIQNTLRRLLLSFIFVRLLYFNFVKMISVVIDTCE